MRATPKWSARWASFPGAVTLINDAEEARTVQPADPSRLAFITQTTLSVDDTAEIVDILRDRFP